jgi:hypothetical protein
MEQELQKLTPDECDKYARAWRTYKKLRNIGMSGLVAFFIFRIFDWERRPGSIWFVFAVIAFVVAIPAGFCLDLWKCPRCNKTFSGRGFRRTSQPWVRKCYYCQLSKGDLSALTKRTGI